MESKDKMFWTSSENFNDVIIEPDISTAIESSLQENQKIYQQIYSNEIISDFPLELSTDDICLGYQLTDSYPSFDASSAVQLPFDSYPTLATDSILASPNNLNTQQNLHYFLNTQQFSDQISEYAIPSSSHHINLLDSSDSLSISQPNFLDLPFDSPPCQSIFTIGVHNNQESNNYDDNSTIYESKQEKKKRQNKVAAQKSREKAKNLLIALQEENDRLKKEYEEKLEEIKRLRFILNRLKEERGGMENFSNKI
ncbi:16192_t:CDS:2 [Funneliformis caledonium]|uniref:16192_t:CDS:1 n=1 Tax=Funneliformis caledonium TaxID=1117310 RepID=A0A9N9CBJ3_9GLOM|nr:16192_t:CDS:2 [Funneliformis caledonium]